MLLFANTVLFKLTDGIITLDDLDQYEVYDKDPTSITLDNGNYTVFNPVPPSSGVIHNFAFKLLDGMWSILNFENFFGKRSGFIHHINVHHQIGTVSLKQLRL